jgi:hypothetical protein
MKNMLIAGLLLLSLSATAQRIDDSKVPRVVVSTFVRSFPGVKDVKWEKENGNYEANFNENGKKSAALIDSSGSLIESEMEIQVDALPAEARTYIAKNYKGKKIKEAAMIKLPNGTVNYEAEIKGKDVIFNNYGEFIKEVEK